MIKFRLHDIPPQTVREVDPHFQGYCLTRPFSNEDLWTKENVRYNDVLMSMFDREIISCGLPKVFNVNERPDIVKVAPMLINWKVYEYNDNQVIVSRYSGITITRRPHCFPEDDLINLEHFPKFNAFLNENEFLDFSVIFQKDGFLFKVLTVIDHETQLPRPSGPILDLIKTYELSLFPESSIKNLGILGIRRYSSNTRYIFFMGSHAVKIDDLWFSKTCDLLSNVSREKLTILWSEYPNRNFAEFERRIKNISYTFEVRKMLKDIYFAFKLIARFSKIIDDKLSNISLFNDKVNFSKSLPPQIRTIGYNLISNTSLAPVNISRMYDEVIAFFQKETV